MYFKYAVILGLLTFGGLQACQLSGSKPNNTGAIEQRVMPKDTFLNRLSTVVSSLAADTWDSAAIIHTLAATPEQYLLAISQAPDSTIEKPGSAILIIRPLATSDLKFDLYIGIPDTLANQLSYKDFNMRFGQPVKDSIGGIPVIAAKEPLISYQISKGPNKVNIVLYSGIINHTGTESIYGLLIYKEN